MWRFNLTALLGLLLLIAAPASAFVHSRAGSVTAAAYTDLCSQSGLSGTCVYAFSVAHRLNSTNAVPFTLTRISDGRTLNASYTGPNFLVNVPALTAFCLGNGGTATTVTTAPTPYVMYNDCNFTTVYDQVGTCNLTPPDSNNVFAFIVDTPTGLPALLGNYPKPALLGAKVQWLTGWDCSAVAGNVSKSMVTYSNSGYNIGTGLMENGDAPDPTVRPIPVVPGSIFSSSWGIPNAGGSNFGQDFEWGGGIPVPVVSVPGPTRPPSGTKVAIYGVGVVTYNGQANVHTEWFNNTIGVPNQTPFQTINTQSRMNIGCSGDLARCGYTFFQDIAITSTDVSNTPGLPRAICLYETSIMGGPGCPNITKYVAIGDSITLGTGASPTSNAFPYLIASDNGIPLTDLGVTGVQACGAFQSQVYPNYAPLYTDTALYTILLGGNDAINNPVGPHETAFKLCLMAAASWLAIPNTNKVYAQAATVTGTWTPDNTDWVTGIAESVGTGSPGSTLTFSSVPVTRGVLYIWYAFPAGGAATFTYKIDGGSSKTVSYNGTSITGVVRVTGLTNTTHSVVITDIAGLPEAIAAVGTVPPPVFVGNATGASPNCCRTLIGGVLQQEGDAMSAVTAAYNADALSVASTLKTDGLNIAGVIVRDSGFNKGPTPNSVCDTSTCMFDTYNPNKLGHRYLANAFEYSGL
jgi:hypothetical protein